MHQTYKKNNAFSLKSLPQAGMSLDHNICKFIRITEFQLLGDRSASLSEIRTSVKKACALCTMVTGFVYIRRIEWSQVLRHSLPEQSNQHPQSTALLGSGDGNSTMAIVACKQCLLRPVFGKLCSHAQCHINQIDVEGAWPHGWRKMLDYLRTGLMCFLRIGQKTPERYSSVTCFQEAEQIINKP